MIHRASISNLHFCSLGDHFVLSATPLVRASKLKETKLETTFGSTRYRHSARNSNLSVAFLMEKMSEKLNDTWNNKESDAIFEDTTKRYEKRVQQLEPVWKRIPESVKMLKIFYIERNAFDLKMQRSRYRRRLSPEANAVLPTCGIRDPPSSSSSSR